MRHALFFCVDRAMFPAAVFAAHTAISNARARPFDTVIIVPENAIEPNWISWAEGHGVHVKEVPLAKHLGISKTGNSLYPPSIFYRYLFHMFLPDCYDKVVYVDADMRMPGDISRLFDLDLGSHAFAACPDPLVAAFDPEDAKTAAYLKTIEWSNSTTYANSGLLVIDPATWLTRGIGERVLTIARERMRSLHFIDQDALNLLVRGEFAAISPTWNMITGFQSDNIVPEVLHYAGPRKPWRPIDWIGAPSEPAIYRAFFRRSPWPQFGSLRNGLTWKKARRRAKKWIGRKLGANVPTQNSIPPRRVQIYREHIRTFDFADRRQGLVAIGGDGILRATDPHRT